MESAYGDVGGIPFIFLISSFFITCKLEIVFDFYSLVSNFSMTNFLFISH